MFDIIETIISKQREKPLSRHGVFVIVLVVAGLCFPLSGFCRGDVKSVGIIRDNGKERCSFFVEVVSTPETVAMGLMHRKSLKARHGMLFVFESDEMHHFWMKNTLISLDMIFIDSGRRIAHIHRKAKPLDTTSISSQRPVRYVLEINGGEADECRMQVGDRVRLPASQ